MHQNWYNNCAFLNVLCSLCVKPNFPYPSHGTSLPCHHQSFSAPNWTGHLGFLLGNKSLFAEI